MSTLLILKWHSPLKTRQDFKKGLLLFRSEVGIFDIFLR